MVYDTQEERLALATGDAEVAEVSTPLTTSSSNSSTTIITIND